MGMPAILGLATALPPNRHAQLDIYELFMVPRIGQNRLVRAAFVGAEIDFRHSVFADGHFYDQPQSTEARNSAYMQHARPLGAEAIRRCLGDAGLGAQEVDELIIVSCTGLDTPGLDLLLAADLGMRHDLRRTSILSMGCYAAFPALMRAADAVGARPGSHVLILCLELCTLHFQDDPSIDNLMAIALFADGAAAALVGDAPGGPRLLAFRTFRPRRAHCSASSAGSPGWGWWSPTSPARGRRSGWPGCCSTCGAPSIASPGAMAPSRSAAPIPRRRCGNWRPLPGCRGRGWCGGFHSSESSLRRPKPLRSSLPCASCS